MVIFDLAVSSVKVIMHMKCIHFRGKLIEFDRELINVLLSNKLSTLLLIILCFMSADSTQVLPMSIVANI